MKDWQKTVQGAVSDGVISIIEKVRKDNPDLAVKANFRVHFPDSFYPGENAIIPVSTPTDRGPLHVANVHLGISDDMYVSDVNLEMGSLDRFDPSIDPSGPVSLRGYLDIASEFFNQINAIISGDAIKRLLAPDVGAAIPTDMPGPTETVINPQTGGRTRVPAHAGRKTTWVGAQREKMLEDDRQKAKSIKSDTQREDYIREALASATRSPSWYYVLGGKAKETMRDRIIKSYMATCDKMDITVPSAEFFDRLSAKMIKNQDILPYCERQSEFISGTASSKCKQLDCPVYQEVGCPKFNFRISDNKQF